MFARTTCFWHLLLLLLLLLLAAAAAAAAPAAAAAAAVLLLLVGPARCFFFPSNSLANAIYMMDLVQNSQKSSGYDY